MVIRCYDCRLSIKFNSIKLIWAQLKREIRRHNTNPKISKGAIEIIKQEVANITGSNWHECVRHTIDVENSYRQINVQKLIINLSSCKSESDSE